MKLFIVGNGFDKEHELLTEYDLFKNYLIEHYGKIDYLPYPEITQMPNGEEISNLKIDANIFFKLIENIGNDEYWGEFEEDLGSINYDELIDLSWNDDDNDIFRQINNNEDLAMDYSKSFDNFLSLFSKGILNIKYDKNIQKIKHKKLFSNNDLYLTFNYTTLLEDVYDIKSSQICHIHGKIENRLVFGLITAAILIVVILCMGIRILYLIQCIKNYLKILVSVYQIILVFLIKYLKLMKYLYWDGEFLQLMKTM